MMTTKGGKPDYADPSQRQHRACALCDQPTQASSTPVVQLVSTRGLLGTLDAAEELKLANLGISDLRVSVCLRKPPPPAVPAVVS